MIYEQISAPIVIVESPTMLRRRTPIEALSMEAQTKLRALMRTLDPLGKLIEKARAKGLSTPPVSKTKSKPRDIRLPKPGDILSRRYRQQEIVVRVLESGFEYEGKRYRSLSAVAKVVTGAHWNGLLFFGIVRQER